jgi:hypothetical protein
VGISWLSWWPRQICLTVTHGIHGPRLLEIDTIDVITSWAFGCESAIFFLLSEFLFYVFAVILLIFSFDSQYHRGERYVLVIQMKTLLEIYLSLSLYYVNKVEKSD